MRVALTIAGSDPSGGAGVQADLKTFAAHDVFGLSVITAVTVQNTLGVAAVETLGADVVTAQIEAVVADIGTQAVKTGMLATAAIVEAVAAAVAALELPLLVVDPVLVSTSGTRLLDDEGLEAMKAELLPRAHVVTPNIPEAEMLSGVTIGSDADRREAARRIRALGPANVVITGGHAANADRIVDLLYNGDVFAEFPTPRVPGPHTHGTGCTFSAAVTAHLALGRRLHDAIPAAQHYVAGAVRHAPGLGRGAGPMHHFWRAGTDRAGRL